MKNWKNHFDSIILKRGYCYYLDGSVDDIEETDEGYEAIVHGSYDYNVTIGIDDGDITYMECTCPYAENGDSCKHEAAVLYELSAEGRLDNAASRKPLYDDRENDAESIISNLGSEALKAFLREEIRANPRIAERLFASFADTMPKEYAAALEREAEQCINLIDGYDEEDYYDDWDDSDPRDEWRDDLCDIAERIKPFTEGRKFYSNTFMLILHILSTLSDYDDDNVACEYAELLKQTYSSADAEERTVLADMAREAISDGACNAEFIRDFLVDDVHDKDISRELLLQAENLLKEHHNTGSEYDKARAMIALDYPDDKIDGFFETCTDWMAVCLYAERLRKRREWSRAAKAINRIRESLSCAEQTMASDFLLDIWREAGDEKEYNAELLNIILRNRQLNADRVRELKSRLSEEEWEKAYAEIIKSDSISYIRSDILFDEADWPRLLEHMRSVSDFYHQDKYIDALYPIYPNEVVEILRNDAAGCGRHMNDRSSYHRYASSLKRLASYSEGSVHARMMAEEMIKENPRKSALRDELRKAGFYV